MNHDAPTPSMQPDYISGERRFNRRYQITLDLRWKLIWRRKVVETGAGRTIDLSSGGILLRPGKPLPDGRQVELSVRWPVLVPDYRPIQLVVSE